jgi:PAB-dependent poly(A)-specific ribonuclease subunit 2
VQILDLKDVGKSSVFQVGVSSSPFFHAEAELTRFIPKVESPSMLTSMAVTPTGEGLAFGDAEGYVHLWSARPEEGEAQFCRFEGEVELPDTAEPIERINWRDDTCARLLLSLPVHC